MGEGINPLPNYFLLIYDNDAFKGKMQFKTYTGKSSSSSNVYSITFNFAPSIVMFASRNSYGDTIGGNCIVMDTINASSYTDFSGWYGNSSSYKISAKKSSDGKTLYWYNGGVSSGTNGVIGFA